MPDKTSGSGNDTVNVGANAHTGRSVRSTILTFSAVNCTDVPVTCNQTGAVESVSMDNSSMSIVKAGATVTVTGYSNSSKLTFSLGSTNNIPLTIPSTYMAGGVSTTNGAAIAGDPGATQKYAFSISFTVAENTSVNDKSSQLIVTDNAGNTATCTLTQAAGDAYLTISPTTITIPADGTAQAVTVTSNTSWTLS
jgi:hypothetical protein